MGRIVSGRAPTRARTPTPPPLRGEPNVDGLRPYQVEGVLWLRSRASALLADEMRLGKTAQVLRALEPPAMVVCPASAKYVWADEAARWRGDLEVTVGAPGELQLPSSQRALAVSTYASLPVPDERARGRWLVPFDLSAVTIVFDEAHYLKSRTAARTERARLLGAQCGRVWGVTGTPLAGHPTDIWGVLTTCRLEREAFGSFEKFARAFGGRLRVLPQREADKKPRRFWEWPADAPPAPAAAEAFARVALRRLRRDVERDLPPKTYQDVRCDLSAEIAAELDRVSWPEGADLPPLEEFSALRARVAAARIPAMLERVESYEETWTRTVPDAERTPLVVFSAHREPVEVLRGRPGWATITGDASAEARRLTAELFRAGLVSGVASTIGAGGVAIDLSRACHVLFVDRSFTPADNVQAEDRLAAVGKTRPIYVERLVSDHPLELRVQAVLDAKQARITAVVRD